MQKIRLFHRFALELGLIKKSCSLICPISQEKKFSQIQGLCRYIANHINFNYRTNPVKSNDRNFQ